MEQAGRPKPEHTDNLLKVLDCHIKSTTRVNSHKLPVDGDGLILPRLQLWSHTPT